MLSRKLKFLLTSKISMPLRRSTILRTDGKLESWDIYAFLHFHIWTFHDPLQLNWFHISFSTFTHMHTRALRRNRAHAKHTRLRTSIRNEMDLIFTNQLACIHNFDMIKSLNFETDHRMIRCKIEISNTRKRKI